MSMYKKFTFNFIRFITLINIIDLHPTQIPVIKYVYTWDCTDFSSGRVSMLTTSTHAELESIILRAILLYAQNR